MEYQENVEIHGHVRYVQTKCSNNTGAVGTGSRKQVVGSGVKATTYSGNDTRPSFGDKRAIGKRSRWAKRKTLPAGRYLGRNHWRRRGKDLQLYSGNRG